MTWVCGQCGFAGSKGAGLRIDPEHFPVHCFCGFTETFEEAVIRNPVLLSESPPEFQRCQYLQGTTQSFNGKLLSCGCSRIYLYPCQHFNELVTLHTIRPPNKVDTADDVRAAIGDFHPEYKGRACQGCEAFTAKETPAPTPT